ncbi:hypothetical protein CJ030_MR5G017084 [Morella rubra]|uniref:Uncharacterized protein n=1 Tax=Morella rubra TaxID=262757 RepID=A0A6A1VLQ6_9ROSI|nr:hypothetical protein CJ030_MR5G017084 [Morella rubra]
MKTLLILFATFFLMLASLQANAERLTGEKEHVPKANRRLLAEANKFTGKVNVAGASDTSDQTTNKVDAATEIKTTNNNEKSTDEDRNPSYGHANTPDSTGQTHRDPVCADYNAYKGAGGNCRK